MTHPSVRSALDKLNQDQRRQAERSEIEGRLAALSNRVLELTPDGIHQYGGGYSEYVERTGYEAPGLRN